MLTSQSSSFLKSWCWLCGMGKQQAPWGLASRCTSSVTSETVVSWGRNNYFTRHLLSCPERRDVTTIFQEKIHICLYMWHQAIPKEYVRRRNFVVGTLTKFMCAESKDLTEYHASTRIAILCHMKVSNCFKNHCKVHNLIHLHRIQCTAEYNVEPDRIQSCSSLFKVVAKNALEGDICSCNVKY